MKYLVSVQGFFNIKIPWNFKAVEGLGIYLHSNEMAYQFMTFYQIVIIDL